MDIGGRYGGEEFGIILTDTDANGAVRLAERLRSAIENQVISHEQHNITYTVSLGVTEVNDEFTDYQAWLERSDQALYQSKNTGRNTVTLL